MQYLTHRMLGFFLNVSSRGRAKRADFLADDKKFDYIKNCLRSHNTGINARLNARVIPD